MLSWNVKEYVAPICTVGIQRCTFFIPHKIFMLMTNIIVQDGRESGENFSYTCSSVMKMKPKTTSLTLYEKYLRSVKE
jgi:hypothetical protein